MMLNRRGMTIAAFVFLAGCSSERPPPAFSDIHFTGAPPIRLDASSVRLQSEFTPSFHAPEVEQDFPVPPQRAIENWAHDRLVAEKPASPNSVRVTILEASAKEGDHGTDCTVRVAAKVEFLDGHGFPIRTAHAEAARTAAVPGDSTLDDRDLVWYTMTREVVGSLGIELERQIRSTFYPYVS